MAGWRRTGEAGDEWVPGRRPAVSGVGDSFPRTRCVAETSGRREAGDGAAQEARRRAVLGLPEGYRRVAHDQEGRPTEERVLLALARSVPRGGNLVDVQGAT